MARFLLKLDFINCHRDMKKENGFMADKMATPNFTYFVMSYFVEERSW